MKHLSVMISHSLATRTLTARGSSKGNWFVYNGNYDNFTDAMNCFDQVIARIAI